MSRISVVSTSRLTNFFDFQKDTLAFFVRMLDQGEMVSLKTGLRPSYIVNSPAFVQEILVVKESSFRKGRTSEVLQRTIGDGLLTAERTTHEWQKKYMLPVFYKERLQEYARTIVEESERLVAQLSQRENCSIHDEMMQLTLAIITRTMFATDVQETKQQLAEAVSATIEQTAKSLLSPLALPYFVPTPGHRRQKQAVQTLEKMVFDTIRTAQNEPERFAMTMLGMLLDTKDEQGDSITETEIRDQMMTMLLAGHETSANLLTWIIYELSQNQAAESELLRELDAIPSWNDPLELARTLPFVNQVIQEGLRLYPPAWLIYREAAEEVELLGERFSADSTFMISPYAMHRNPAIFEAPNQFRPERFAGNALAQWPKFAYFPFGGGSRSCIGSRFALLEVALILGVLYKKLRFRMTDPTQLVKAEPLVSLRVQGELRMDVSAR